MRSALTAEQQERLLVFQEISQISDQELCVDILRENNWDIETAVDSFVQGRRPSPRQASRRGQNVQASARGATASAGAGSSAATATDVTQGNTSSSRAPREIGFGFLDKLLAPLRWLFQSRPISLNPEGDTRKFIAEFDGTFGGNHPVFMPTTYQEAVRQAFRSSKFLMIYLHSPLHEDSCRFCRYSSIIIILPSRFTNFNMLICVSVKPCALRSLNASQMTIFSFGLGKFGTQRHIA
jgi:hypothetical protein